MLLSLSLEADKAGPADRAEEADTGDVHHGQSDL